MTIQKPYTDIHVDQAMWIKKKNRQGKISVIEADNHSLREIFFLETAPAGTP